MPTYDGIGSSITHEIEVVGDVFISNVEGGSLSTQVPFEIFSNVYGMATPPTDSRQVRLRVQPTTQASPDDSYVSDMGIQNTTDNYFFITAPQNTSSVGDQNTFVISKTSNVGIGTTNPTSTLHVVGDELITGTLSASANIVAGGNVVATNFFYGDGGLMSNISTGAPTFQEVTTQGATTTDSITIGGLTTSNITSTFNTLTATTDVTMVQASGGGTLTIGVQDASVDQWHSGFVDADGNLWMTGKNDYGQCGDALSSALSVNYRKVLTGVSKVFCAYYRTMVIKNDGSLWGFGRNFLKNLGVSGEGFYVTPVELISASPSKIVKVTGGNTISLALKEDGSVWGAGKGQGFGLPSGYYNWTQLSITGSAASGIDISCPGGNYNRSFIIDTNNDLYGCGDGDQYGFGNGSTADLSSYTSLTTGVINVSSDAFATTALVSDGSLLNAGVFKFGSYGDTTVTKTVTTWTASTLTGKSITSVSHGEDFRIVKDSNSDIYGTGRNFDGELGVASPSSLTSWTLLASGVSKHECGKDASYYIDSSNDKLYLSGENGSLGYLGFGTASLDVKPWTVNPATYTAYTGHSLTAVDIDVTGTLSTGSLTTSVIMTGGNFVGDTITSNISLTANATITGTLSTNYISIDTATSSNLSISSNLEVGSSNLFVDTATGRVGIGTASPVELLDIKKTSSDNFIRIQAGSGNSNVCGIQFTEDNIRYGWRQFYDAGSDRLQISTQNNSNQIVTNVMSMLYNGRVGIGTDSPTESLEVNGTIRCNKIYSYTGSTTITGSATTIFTGVQNGSVWLLTCITNAFDGTYGSAFVFRDIGDNYLQFTAGNNLAGTVFTASGGGIKLYSINGATYTVQWSILRLL